MKTPHNRALCAMLAALTGLTGCGASDENATPDSGLGKVEEPFSTTPGEPNHEAVTALGLSFLRPEIVTALQVANVATDVEFFFVNANHFDDCNFTGGAEVVAASQAEAVALLDPSRASPENDALAMRAFARSLHALQDFYAHTNWVELGGETLVDASLAPFPSFEPYAPVPSTGFIVVQGPKPKRAALTRKRRSPSAASADPKP